MVKHLGRFLAVGIVMTLLANYAAATNVLTELTSGAGTLVDGAKTMYEASVVARMLTRSGAATETGSKGIAFEVLYNDKKNFLLNGKGETTFLSTSSTDQLADLYTENADGKIIELIQCKDGTSTAQVNKILADVSNGKYEGADLVGTKELTKVFNSAAEKKGIDVRMKDSGISTKTTSRIANKALGHTMTASELAAATLKASGISAGIAALITIAECAINGDDFYTSTGKVVGRSSITFTSTAIGVLSKTAIMEVLTALGASAGVVGAGGFVVGIVVATAVGYGLYILADEYEYESGIAAVARRIGSGVSDVAAAVGTYFTAPERKAELMEFGTAVAETTTTTSYAVGDFFKNAYLSAKAWTCNTVLKKA